MTPKDTAFVRRCIKRYYFERFDDVEMPSDMSQREFGYVAGAGMVRHIQLFGPADLRVLLLRESPLDVFCSNARYLSPTMQMDGKAWQDAHVIFDIDAKDIGLECRPSHAVTVCNACGATAAGARDPCGKCGGTNTSKKSVACTKCMRAAGRQAAELLYMLKTDFGVEDARTYFSGNEGYHIHVHDGSLAGLSRASRSELADYVSLHGADPGTLCGRGVQPPKRTERGWRGRFARAIRKPDRDLMVREVASGVHSTRDRIMGDLGDRLGVRVDAGVTMDVHRIFRMPGTINSKSCMAKAACSDPRSYDPYESAVVVSDDAVSVEAACPVAFRLRGRRFGQCSGMVELPMYAAAYMVCKGLAHVVG